VREYEKSEWREARIALVEERPGAGLARSVLELAWVMAPERGGLPCSWFELSA